MTELADLTNRFTDLHGKESKENIVFLFDCLLQVFDNVEEERQAFTKGVIGIAQGTPAPEPNLCNALEQLFESLNSELKDVIINRYGQVSSKMAKNKEAHAFLAAIISNYYQIKGML